MLLRCVKMLGLPTGPWVRSRNSFQDGCKNPRWWATDLRFASLTANKNRRTRTRFLYLMLLTPSNLPIRTSIIA
jgi:hypothetical protein